MAFWDKIGDAYNWVKDTAVPTVGGAFSAAQNWVDTTPGVSEAYDAINPIHALVTNPATAPVVNTVVDQGAGLVSSAFSYGVARPLSTAMQVGQSWDTLGHAMSNVDDWREAWNRSADISFGQSTVIDFNSTNGNKTPGTATFDMTPEAQKNREDFFHNTWQGQVTSGALDLALNLGGDPTVAAAKGIKGAALARNTFKGAGEVDRALKVNAGDAASASRRETALSGRMDKFFGQLDGKSSAEIALHPVVKESDQSGVFASLFGQINQQVTDEAARRAAQRNVYGAMLGNASSVDALKDQHALLANELRRLSDTPIATKAVDDPNALAAANAATPVEVSEQKDLIEKEIARLEAATSATGTVNRLAGTVKEQYRYNSQINGLRQSTLNTGLGNMPVRVLAGPLANRLPGHVSVKNPVDGFVDLENTLRQAPWIAGTDRRQLLDSYVNAATDGDRQRAVLDAEGAIVHSTAAKYGIDPTKARQLLNAGRDEHRAIMSQLSSRLYSAAEDDKFVSVVHPETGEITAWSRPILQSQIEDNVSIVDPRRLDAALKGLTENRMMERVLDHLGDDPKGLATAAYEKAGSAQMLAVDGLTQVTRLWKDAALMRLAYPARVQIDSQMRLMTHMGAMAYLGGALGSVKAEGRHLLSAQGSDKLSLRNLFKEGDYEKSLTGILKDAGVHEDDIPTIVRKLSDTDGGVADLAGEMSNTMLARARATGEWGYVEGTNAAWAPAYVRAVNNQIRNSAVAMKAAEGAGADELRAFVANNPAARREWLNLKSSYGGDLDAWLGSVQAHVNHYLPTAEMKSAVVGKPGTVGHSFVEHGDAPPAWEGGPQLFHGTAKRFTGDVVNPDARAGNPLQNFLGQGFYAATDRTYAEDYAQFGRGESSALYGVRWKGSKAPDVLDLATSKNTRFRNYVDQSLAHYEKDVAGTKAGDLATELRGEIATGATNDEDMLYGFVHFMQQSGLSREVKADVMDDVAKIFRVDADVLKASNGHHVFLDPKKVETAPVKTAEAVPATDGLPGRGVTAKDIDAWFGDVSKRMRVHGESYAPTAKSPIAEWYEGKRNSWYKFAAEAPETTMARTPLYVHAFKRNLSDIVARHGGEDAIDAETMTNIRRSADRLARREVGKILFDTSHASNLSRSMRFASPFFSAWEDMMKKWSGLFYDKPWAPVRFEQAWQAPNNAGIVVDENGNRIDAEGNAYEPGTGRKLDPKKDAVLIGKRQLVTIPAGILGKFTGQKSFSIDKNSFNIVFQGDPWWLPGAGPLVQVPVNEVVKNEFPEAASNPIIAAVLPMGVSDNSVADQLLPSWIRQAHNAFGNTQDHANVQAMLLAQETARFNNGERGPIKAGEIADMTRNWFILRAVTANASPVSMAPTPKAQFYIDQAHIYRQKYGQDWQQKFYNDFPQWYEMSLSLSNNETGIVATLNAVDAAKKYRKEIADNPEYGWAAVGPDNQYGQTPGTAFNQAAYAWQEQPVGYGQQTPFRGKSSPQDALAKAEASKGWIQYQGIMTKLNLVLESRGLHSFQQTGAEDLAGLKKQAEDILGSTNDAWRQDFLSTDSGKVVNFLDWAQKASAGNGTLAKRPDMVALGHYIQMRSAIQGILANRTKHSLDDPGNADVKALWGQGTDLLRQGNIGFEQAWNRVLQHDDPSQELMGMSANGN